MKHVDYLYFNVYNYFYRISQLRPSFNPRMQTMCIFSLGSGGWLLLLQSLYLHFIKHARFANKSQSTLFAVSVYMLTAVLFHYVFIVNGRDEKIFGKYEERSARNPRQGRHFRLSMVVLFLPYLAMIALAIAFPRH